MDIGSLATALVASRAAQAQIAVAARMARMNAHMEASVVQLLDAAQQNAEKLAAATSQSTIDKYV